MAGRAGLTWLERAPKIKLLPMKDQRAPYPLSREEQSLFFQELPDHLARMALFKVNTGCREQEVCGLRSFSAAAIRFVSSAAE